MHFGFAISPRATNFGPMLFAGRLEEGLRHASELGFDAVELSLRSAADVEAEKLHRMLADRGLRLSALATGQACLYDSLCLSSTEESVRAATLELLQTEIRLAAEFGASVIIGGIRGKLTGGPSEQGNQKAAAVRSIRECAQLAARLDVTLLIEPINRYETNFINNVTEALELLDAVADPSLKLLLDTFHMNIEEVSLPASVRLAGDRLGYLHVADSNRHAPGQGHIDYSAIFEALNSIGYDGRVVAEILPLPDDIIALQQTASFLEPLGFNKK